MTKQDEIRKEIDTHIQFVIMAAYLAGQTRADVRDTKEKCTAYLKDALHSQGVVIKVDRELPNIQFIKGNRAFVRAVKEAGFVAVEPLIKL